MKNMELSAVKEFVLALEKNKISYVVVADFAIDAKRGKPSRPHEDLDVFCLKTDELKVEKLVKDLKYVVSAKHQDLYKLKRADGAKVDLCLVNIEGAKATAKGKIANYSFPKEMMLNPEKGKIADIEMNIPKNELLAKFGQDSPFDEDVAFVETLKVDAKQFGLIKRIFRSEDNV